LSQVSIIDIEGNHPQIPTTFVADVGFAIPIANTLNILGDTAAAGTTPVHTTGSGNTITTIVQRSQGIAATDATKVGLAAFDSTDFSVDANGFVTLNAAGAGQTITGQSGGALSPSGGNWNIFATSVAAGTSPAATSGVGSTLTVNIQRSQAIGAADSTRIGLAAFDSNIFSVDPTGFVSLLGGGLAIDSVAVQAGTSPIVPTAAGLITINGAVVAAGTNPVRTNGTGANTLAVQVQTSQAIAAADATKIGLANFNSSHFSVTSDGFVSLTGGGQAIDSFTTDVSGPVSPDGSGNVAFTGATNIFSSGSVANTMRLNVQGTNHALFVGRGTNTASANLGIGTDGQALLAATGADPAFATIATNANMNTVVGANSLTLNPYNCAKWIVDATANIGTHQTIAAALTAASSGDTIFIRPGTYTENLTLKAGVHLTAFLGDDLTPNVTIVGKASATFAGTCTISNIKLQTNSDNFLAITGSNNTVINLVGCYLLVANAVAGISYTTSGTSASLNILDCDGDVSSSTGWLFTSTAVGAFFIRRCRITTSGNSAVVNTTSSTIFEMTYCYFIGNFKLTNPTGGSAFRFCRLGGVTTYTIETVTSGSLNIENCFVGNDTTSCITVGTGSSLNVNNSTMSCIGTSNAIVGAGSISMDPISYGNGIGQTITVTSITDMPFGRFNSWNPSIAFGGSSTGVTYSSRSAAFWVIGKMVFFNFTMALSNNGSGTGAATITGLPTGNAASDQTFIVMITNLTFPAGATYAIGILGSGGVTIALWGVGTTTFTQLTQAHISDTSTVQMSGFYWAS